MNRILIISPQLLMASFPTEAYLEQCRKERWRQTQADTTIHNYIIFIIGYTIEYDQVEAGNAQLQLLSHNFAMGCS